MQNISLLTLNLHCFEENEIKKNQDEIVKEIIQKEIDIIFLQEVAQYHTNEIEFGHIKVGNYGYVLKSLLEEKGYRYYYQYEPIKYSFGKYDEGVALLSKYPIENVSSKYISKVQDYMDWKSRKYIKGTINVRDKRIDLYSVHLGWNDENESYLSQVKKLTKSITSEITLIGGDFNVNCGGELFNKTLNEGLIDLYGLDENKRLDPTHEDNLDVHKFSSRIDYIFSTKTLKVLDQCIMFKENKVSDHYGLYLKIQL